MIRGDEKSLEWIEYRADDVSSDIVWKYSSSIQYHCVRFRMNHSKYISFLPNQFSFIRLKMSTRNRTSTSSASKIDHPLLALNESYDEEIAPLLTTIDQSKSFRKY